MLLLHEVRVPQPTFSFLTDLSHKESRVGLAVLALSSPGARGVSRPLVGSSVFLLVTHITGLWQPGPSAFACPKMPLFRLCF